MTDFGYHEQREMWDAEPEAVCLPVVELEDAREIQTATNQLSASEAMHELAVDEGRRFLLALAGC